MTILFKRGTTEQNDQYVGHFGEITVDTTLKTFRLHDGQTPGGIRTARSDSITPAETIESMISGHLFVHTYSQDHDTRYFTKTETDEKIRKTGQAVGKTFISRNNQSPVLLDDLNEMIAYEAELDLNHANRGRFIITDNGQSHGKPLFEDLNTCVINMTYAYDVEQSDEYLWVVRKKPIDNKFIDVIIEPRRGKKNDIDISITLTIKGCQKLPEEPTP